MNDNNEMEIKLQSRGAYYFDIIKIRILSIIRPLGIILACILALYVGFYVILFIIVFSGLSYLLRNIFKK